MDKIIYKEAYEKLLSRLRNCGNLITQEYFDEDTGESHIRRSYHLIQIIEDYMCDILEEQNALSTLSAPEGHRGVFIERAGNITKHGSEAIRAVAGTDEEYSAYVDKYSTKEVICKQCNDECDCHIQIGGSGKPCPDCSNLNKNETTTNTNPTIKTTTNNPKIMTHEQLLKDSITEKDNVHTQNKDLMDKDYLMCPKCKVNKRYCECVETTNKVEERK